MKSLRKRQNQSYNMNHCVKTTSTPYLPTDFDSVTTTAADYTSEPKQYAVKSVTNTSGELTDPKIELVGVYQNYARSLIANYMASSCGNILSTAPPDNVVGQ